MEQSKKEKINKFIKKYNVFYFLLVGCLFALNGILYEIGAIIPTPNHFLDLGIDNAIPFIPEFCFFYTLFYVCPFIFIYGLSFFDKKKVFTICCGGAVGVVICFISYLIYNIQIIRPVNLVDQYWFFDGSITNIHEFFLALVHFQYIVDPLARNCMPSLHALFGGLIFISGCPMSFKERHTPILFRIFAMIFGLGITVSTFMIKQHYFIDAIVGFSLAIMLFFIAKIVFKFTIKKHPNSKLANFIN